MRKILLLLLVPLVAGCANNEQEVWDLQAKLDVKDVEIADLKQKMVTQKAQHKRTINILQDSIERTEKELKRTREDLQEQVRQRDNKLTELKAQFAKLMRPATDAGASPEALPPPPTPPPPPVKISTVTTPQTKTAIRAPGGTEEDLFPFRVYEVEGKKSVTGTHTSPRYVETDETYRDEFGNKKKRGQWKQETVEEFGYKVTFSIENPTDEDETVVARAGLVDKVIFLRAGESQEDIVLDAAKGSSLIVSARGRRRRIEVSY